VHSTAKKDETSYCSSISCVTSDNLIVMEDADGDIKCIFLSEVT
jgi:hypothetical protein